MSRFLFRRVAAGLLVVVGVTSIVFVVTRIISDPVRLMLPLGASQETRDQMTAALGLDAPLWAQYVDFLSSLATFDFGDSIWQRSSARDIIFSHLPNTLQLAAVGLGLSFVVFIPLGVAASAKPGSAVDKIIVALSLVGISTPAFWLGALLILFFSVQLDLLPTSGSGSPRHLVLPALTVAVTSGARIAQITRAAMIDQFGASYVSALRGRGFDTIFILRRHVLRNALPAIIAISFWESAAVVAGEAIVIETVFAWPGLGYLLVQALQRQDVILLQACVFVAAVLVAGLMTLADIVLKMVDPRIELN